MSVIRINDTLTVDSISHRFRMIDGTNCSDSIGLRELVRAVRERCNLSAAELAERLDTDERSIRRWAAGDYTPSPDQRNQLVSMLAATLGPASSAENPLIIAALMGPMIGAAGTVPTPSEQELDRLANIARCSAKAVDRVVAAERVMREQATRA